MCGLNGIVHRRGGVERGRLVADRDRLRHRGPDDAGVWLSPDRRVGLAHRRLAILDLSSAGHQPLLRADGRLAIVYNGELYNFEDLRSELERQGVSFVSSGDTEVILAAYRAWGADCLARFNGMFAFAIYDAGGDGRPASLFLARDGAGEKPLYYALAGDSFAFASELKALASPAGIDVGALNHFLAFGYVGGARCLAAGAAKLPPGHAARLDLASWKLDIWCHWRLPTAPPAADAAPEDLADELEPLLVDSVRLRLRSDVPTGVLLSGGVDSSLVAAAAVRASSRPVDTFTMSIPGSALDERRHAEAVATALGTRHHVLTLESPSLDAIAELAPLVDEPIADSSILPTFLLSRLVRRHVTVALGGDGGDELFGGYAHYRKVLRDARRWGWVPRPCWRALGAAASRLPAGLHGRPRLASLRAGPFRQAVWGTSYFDLALRRRLLTPEARASLGDEIAAPEREMQARLGGGGGIVDRLCRLDFQTVLADDYLVKIDRASMASSLELRSPHLDPRLIDFAFSRIPDRCKVQGDETRRVQRLLARRWLPAGFDVNRKQGFSIPMEEWLRSDRCAMLRERVADLPEAVDRSAVDALIAGQMRGRSNGSRLFALTMLAVAARNNGWR